MTEEDLIKSLAKSFDLNRNSDFAKKMKDYLRGQFDFFGIKMSSRREISKDFFKAAKSIDQAGLIRLSKSLYNRKEREFHHNAVEVIVKNFKVRNMERKDIAFFEWLVSNNSWWDTVDVVAPKLMRDYFIAYPEERNYRLDQWLESGDIWLVRSAILVQLKMKEKTDLTCLFDTILKATGTNEFFINKAIGWILRENSKRIPKEIEAFINKNKAILHPLAIREGMRIIKK